MCPSRDTRCRITDILGGKNILKMSNLVQVGRSLKPWRVGWGARLSVQLIKVSGPNFVGRKPLGSGREMLCNCAEEGTRNNNTIIECCSNNNNMNKYRRCAEKFGFGSFLCLRTSCSDQYIIHVL